MWSQSEEVFLTMSLMLDGQEYQIKGQKVFRADQSLISRIVYQCSECPHLSKTIIESDEHFQQAHPELAGMTMADRMLLAKNPYKTHPYNSMGAKQVNMPSLSPTAVPAKNPENDRTPISGLGLGVSRAMLMKTHNRLTHATTTSSGPISSGPTSSTAPTLIPLHSNGNFVPIKCKVEKEEESRVYVPGLYSGLNDFKDNQTSKNLKTYSKRKPIENIDTGGAEAGQGKSIASNLLNCKVCGKIFTKHSMIKHMRMHQNPLACSYPFCETEFGSERELKEHIELYHPLTKPKGETFQCQDCPKSYLSEKELSDHRLVQKGLIKPQLSRVTRRS